MKSIIFFDDQCPLCRRTINFLHRQDRHHRLHFASLESKTAHRFLNAHFRTLNTVVFLEMPGRLSIRGRAVFRILGHLSGLWRGISWMQYLPFIDFVYNLIARHRKRGGKLEPLDVDLLP
jgi:predicted DCC family thiol-disulfide oxidoreductase YuxK